MCVCVEGGGVATFTYIHTLRPLSQKSEESNLSRTDATKHQILLCIFQLVSVFSAVVISLSRIVDLCRNVKGVFVPPEIGKEKNKYCQTNNEEVST